MTSIAKRLDACAADVVTGVTNQCDPIDGATSLKHDGTIETRDGRFKMVAKVSSYGEYRNQGWSMFQVKVPHVRRHDGRKVQVIIAHRETQAQAQEWADQYNAGSPAQRHEMTTIESAAYDQWRYGMSPRPWQIAA